jgi:hypothetical protein
MIWLLVILIVLYITSIFGCIEPLASRKIELNLPVLLLVLCPIVNTIIALRYAKWSDVERVFKSKDTSKTC